MVISSTKFELSLQHMQIMGESLEIMKLHQIILIQSYQYISTCLCFCSESLTLNKRQTKASTWVS